ncbi:ATP synthase delta chain, chloroplastic [Linum grandiflorum]
METLSGHISNFRVPSLHPPPRDICSFRTPNASLHNQHHHLSAKPKSQSAAPATRTSSPTLSLRTTNSTRTSSSASPNTHRRPASGYAAALVDIAHCKGALDAVQKDVRRLSRVLRNDQIRNFLRDPLMGSEEKGGLVEEVGKRGRIGELLMSLVKMLIGKNRVGILQEVLMEFERICDEMVGTQRVLVSTAKKMDEGEIFRIARTVQESSGGKSVKIRNFIHDNGGFTTLLACTVI